MTLDQQLNVKCNGPAKGAVMRSMMGAQLPHRGCQLLPQESAAVFVDNQKQTTDMADAVQFALGGVEARQFYTAPKG